MSLDACISRWPSTARCRGSRSGCGRVKARAPTLLPPVALSRGDLEAGREALDIPLERAREGLVEVVEVEDEIALRRCEAAEIGEVGVAGELGREPGSRRRGEVMGHHDCRPAEERERRDE